MEIQDSNHCLWVPRRIFFANTTGLEHLREALGQALRRAKVGKGGDKLGKVQCKRPLMYT